MGRPPSRSESSARGLSRARARLKGLPLSLRSPGLTCARARRKRNVEVHRPVSLVSPSARLVSLLLVESAALGVRPAPRCPRRRLCPLAPAVPRSIPLRSTG